MTKGIISVIAIILLVVASFAVFWLISSEHITTNITAKLEPLKKKLNILSSASDSTLASESVIDPETLKSLTNFLHSHRIISSLLRVLFWFTVSIVLLSILALFYILVLHNILFPKGLETGLTAFDDAMDWLFDFLKAEAKEEVPHDPLESRGLFSGKRRLAV